MNLIEVDLSNSELTGTLFAGSNIRGANLLGTNASDAIYLWTEYDDTTLFPEGFNPQWPFFYRLGRAENLSGICLRRKFLYEVDFSSSDFTGSDLRGSCCELADFSDAVLVHANLSISDFSGAVLRRSHLQGANFQRTNLRRADLEETDLRFTLMKNAFYDAKTKWPTGFNPTVAGCLELSATANFDGRSLSGAYLADADLRSATFLNTDLRRVALFGTNLEHADLSGAKLRYATYNSSTKWPEGFDPISAGAVKTSK